MELLWCEQRRVYVSESGTLWENFKIRALTIVWLSVLSRQVPGSIPVSIIAYCPMLHSVGSPILQLPTSIISLGPWELVVRKNCCLFFCVCMCVSSTSDKQDDYRRGKSCSPLLRAYIGKCIVHECYLTFEISNSHYSSYWDSRGLKGKWLWCSSGSTVKTACWVICWLYSLRAGKPTVHVLILFYDNVLQGLGIYLYFYWHLTPKPRTSCVLDGRARKIMGWPFRNGLWIIF